MGDYKLAPVKPTPEMEAAGKYAMEAGCYVSGIYADMLAEVPAMQEEPVGWQFYQDGKWWNGDDRIKDHRKNTEEAGYPVRDVYAAPQPSGHHIADETPARTSFGGPQRFTTAEQRPVPEAITAGMLEAIWRDGFDAENYDDQAYCQPLIIARIAVEEAQPTPDVEALLEALQECVESMRDAFPDFDHFERPAYKAAVDAIAKATGEAQ